MMIILLLLLFILRLSVNNADHADHAYHADHANIYNDKNKNDENHFIHIKQFLQQQEALLYAIYPYLNLYGDIYSYPFQLVLSMLNNEKQASKVEMTECPILGSLVKVDPRILSDIYRTAIYVSDNNTIGYNLNKLNCLLNDETYRDKTSRILAVISYQSKLYGYAIYHAINALNIYPMDRFLNELVGVSLQQLNLPAANITFYSEIKRLSYMHEYTHDVVFRLLQIPNNDRNIYNQLLKDRPISYGEQFNTNKNFLYSYLMNPASSYFTQHRNNVCKAEDTSFKIGCQQIDIIHIEQELYQLCHNFYNLHEFIPKKTVDWSHLTPVKLLCYNDSSLDSSHFYSIFKENCQGLSDSLWLIDIPNEIVTYVTKNDESLYILFYNFPKASLLNLNYNLIPKNYIIYNQEKNAQVESEDYPEIGFTCKCSASVSVDNFTYPAKFVADSLLIWEYSQCNIPTWEKAGKKVFYIPQSIPHQTLHETCQKLKIEKLLNVNSYSKLYDVLFYGSNYEYRNQFYNVATEYIALKFVATSTKILSSQSRDRSIDESKVVLNLRSCEGLDGHMNTHRIRHLLGKAKLVITDRSGCEDDEQVYNDNSAIAIGDNFYNIIQLVQSILKSKDQAQKYEIRGFIYILKDIIMDLFEKDINNDSCQYSKSFIIQLYCSMEYTKVLLEKNGELKDGNKLHKHLWKKRLYENPIRLNI